MFTIAKNRLLFIAMAIFSVMGYAQDEDVQPDNSNYYHKLEFYNLRGTNVVDAGAGLALINGDYPDPEMQLYVRVGYKHYFSEYLSVGLSFNRFNIAFNETFNEDFMSFDLNLECLITPFNEFSPFVYGGYGYNTNTSFDNSQPKVQAGLGVEFIVFEQLGLKLFGEYNFALSNEMEGLILPDTDDSFIRAGIGLNFYFGGEKRKNRLMEDIDTVINSNLIK